MNHYPNPLDPEALEFELQEAYPGLCEGEYQDIAWRALNPSHGQTRGREWGLNSARLALLEKTRRAPSSDDAWNE